MRVKLLLYSAVLTFLFSSSLLFGQFEDPRIWNTQIQPTGEPFVVPPSHINYIHPNKLPKIVPTPLGTATVGISVRVHPSNFTQSEVPIQKHPTDPNTLFGSSNSVRISPFFISEGVYVTNDGGLTWHGSDTCKTTPVGGHGGDPAPAIDAAGRFYMTFLDGGFNGLKAAYSTDGGSNWSSIINIITGSQDKNHTVVDNQPNSPYFGRVYATWSRFTASAPPIAVSYSTNSGVNWSSPVNINTPPANHYAQGCNGAIGPNGEVYVAWQSPILGSPYTGDFMGFGKSTDGGVTWTVNNNIYDCNGIRGFLFATSIRVNDFPWMGVDTSGGSRNGWIYIVHAEKNLAPAGSDPDIILHRSTDGGTTWSAGIRVNQDALNNGAEQYMPALVVSGDDGAVNVVYYDARNLSNDSASVYLARSLDGGDSWTEIEVSDHHFKPKSIPGLAGGYQGDYIGVTESNGTIWPYWADDKTGIYQAWTAPVTFGDPCPVGAPSNPNPVSGANDVSINLPQISWTNGVNATTTTLYFGTDPGSMPIVQSGSLFSSWDITSLPLSYGTTYYWRVINEDGTCGTAGPTWSFTTEQDPNLLVIFNDDFEAGSGNWNITNDGGNCVWQIIPLGSRSYTMPSTAAGNVFAADADLCGSGTTTNTTATLITPVDATGYNTVWIEFDNDWQAIDNADFAYIDVSTDGGSTWTNVLTFDETDVRASHENIDISAQAHLTNFLVRLRSVQPGWDWWWAIDNFQVWASDPVPVELTSFTGSIKEKGVELNWSTATELNNQGFEIEKKVNGQFQKIGYVPGFGTTTEIKNYSYLDTKFETGKNIYRLKQIDFGGVFEYSNEVDVEVNVPLEFSLEQNFPNPFNPTTTIKYSIADEGFVNLTVFNLLGEKVATLISKNMKPGRYTVDFDANNLSTGIYVYRLDSGKNTSIKKMILMK